MTAHAAFEWVCVMTLAAPLIIVLGALGYMAYKGVTK